MTGLEMKNFYNQDKRQYRLKENFKFLSWYKEQKKYGLYSILTIEQMQKLIDEITLFFEFKYPDNIFISYNKNEEEYAKTIELSKLLDIEQLKYRLDHDYKQFLECSYGCILKLEKETVNLYDLNSLLISVNNDGTIEKHSLEDLKYYDYVKKIDEIKNVEQLFGYYEANDTNVDYLDLKKFIKWHKYNVTIRNKILSLIPLSILYSTNSGPKMGYERAKSFIRIFNKEYNLDLDINELNKIMNQDYKYIKEAEEKIEHSKQHILKKIIKR